VKRSSNVRISLLASSLALAACSDSSQPVAMTDANVPRYQNRAECVRLYGEENCREARAPGTGLSYYHPRYTPGQTFFYPGRGYYQGSPTARPPVTRTSYTPRGGTPTTSTPSGGAPTSGTPRGGFGSTAHSGSGS